MDYDNTGGVVSGGCDGCGHDSCDFDLILPLTFEERYNMHIRYHCYMFLFMLS